MKLIVFGLAFLGCAGVAYVLSRLMREREQYDESAWIHRHASKAWEGKEYGS